ncbi:uncharacterized protein LOC124168433 isoform X1 [Ischnura elegans]|uniref:uncharacterized protein LOC124168433 isoform X1 n=1 Tax=Ischnura elegans TaxID=197161 RepID=UPI001ED893B7|nr:uncharacterized protein LOC124168433 isoform X1 [Ischnura elegans]XP_046402612.1 uncharacterized protein LOC124168433 isoform X1 [Ischnura elegans]XP_046402613.1 uncharacterized protein LOC124168433 isoform X1 [Ischnura elegans]
MVVDGGMAVLLLKADSLLHSLRSEVGSLKLEKFTMESVELREFFEKRNSIHDAIKRDCSVAEAKELLGSEESLYLINSMGESALWQAAKVVNVDVWSYLNSKRMKCASEAEEESMKISIKSFQDRFNGSLTQYFFEVRGTHVMKMVAKSRSFGKREGNSWDLGRRLKELYEALDEYEETQIVLEVLQDELDFEVVLDFESDSVKHACIKSLSASDWGLTDFRQKRVYVGAREKSIKDRCSVLGTLSHELTHKALMVVFRNQGKPYHEEDTERMTKYQGIVQEIMYSSNFSTLDEAIRRVAENYEKNLWDQELIVRVPEVIAKYGYSSDCGEAEKVGGEDCYSEDGITLLTEQVEPLLKYYRDEVMPAFREYVESIFTSNKLTVKMMSEYQRLLLNCMNGSVSVGPNVQDIEENILCHNGLKVLLVSCVELCYSHLKLVYGSRGKNVLLIGWSQYNQSQAKKEYMDGLSNGAYDLLAVRWDSAEEPKFCKRGKCYGDCLGNMFHGMSSNIILILTKVPSSLKKLKQLEYVWNDLSEITKSDILKKRVNFVGRASTTREVVFNGVGDENKVDQFMMENVTSSDISLFLMDGEVNIGKVTGLVARGSAEVIDQKCYMKRHFSGRCITFSDSLIRRHGELFVVKNPTLSDLQCSEIKPSMVRVWNESNFDKYAHFYVLNDANEESINVAFERICSFHADKEGIHLLEYWRGKFLYIKSHGSVEGLLDYLRYDVEEVSIPEEKFLNHQICLPSVHGDSGVVPVIIADDPGCGKSFILNNFVSCYRKKYSGAWIVVVDLNFYAQEKSPLQLGKIGSSQTVDLIEVLLKMVGHGSSSFERSLLKKYCEQDCKVIVMFDGFDEICPKYRENVLEFLVGLKSKTKVRVCASTRLHERRELELKLNVISFKLIPFNDLEQVDFLCRYWKANLKKYSGQERVKKMDSLEKEMTKWLRENFPEENKIEGSGSTQLEIDHQRREYNMRCNKNIDFEAFAQKLILSIDSLFKDFREFTRTPLHVKMFAFVLFEENFIIGSRWDLGHLYEKFVEIKLRIFDREKALASGNVASEKSFSMARNRIFEQLENLSSVDFFDPCFFQCNRSEMYDVLSIGLIVEKEEKYQFVHRTFGEYFFARWLLKRAENESVTKFWLETLFTDRGLFRVRWFIEDILHAYYDRVESYNYLENSFGIEVTCLCRSIFLEERLLVCLNACLFGVIVSGYIYLLQYFAIGYDCMFIKLLMGDKNFPVGCSGNEMEDTVSLILDGKHEKPINILPEYDNLGMSIYRHPKIIHSVSAPRHNAFKLIYYKHSKRYIMVKMVQKIFSMIEKYKMEENLNAVFEEKGLCWILPHSFMVNEDYRAYFEVVVDFLVRKIAFFKSSLKKSFLYMPDVFKKVYSQDMGMFRVMTRITDCLENSDLEVMFLKNNDFFELFLKVTRYSNCDSILEMWEYVNCKLSSSTSKLEFVSKSFISRADIYCPKYLNFLICAMVSDNVEKITLVWEIALKVMSREAFVEWFQTSICKGRPSINDYTSSRPTAILKFVRKQLIDGHMTKDEVVKILLMKDSESHRYFLKNDYGEYVIEWHFLMYKLLSEDLKSKRREILLEMEYIYYNLVQLLGDGIYQGMSLNPTSDICVNLGVTLSTFQKIVMSHPNILGDTVQEEYASIFNEPVRWSILLLIHWYLEIGFECLGRELLYKFSQTDVAFSPSCPNIIHKTLRCKIPCVVGFICADFHKYLGDYYMINLLFMGDGNGDTVFHITAREGCIDIWGKFYDTARIVLKEYALEKVHLIENNSGKRVLDLFYDK